ncbi:hypothetical protein PAXRUDRAFT_28798 [Paxillus rubicundulus Ve08.2h10]|uniref:Uncharacterized protein n=1 Tax=Paxillus rubicundulus Ve08.2h10 TaxID=930991 RepID=A0A0D0CQ68_9AGAM|nr:hypothetical protein PAXRUDRAFT_28798 [Paxillus rubicundulus Ve08.2h10]
MSHSDSELEYEDFSACLATVGDSDKEDCNEEGERERDSALDAGGSNIKEVLKKSSDLDLKIVKAVKKYTMFYHFWINNLFLTTPKPNINPHSPAHWSSPESMADGTIVELYKAVLQELHEKMEIYKGFGSLDSTGLLFAPLNVSPKLYSSQSHDKASNVNLLCLLKKPESVRMVHLLLFGKSSLSEKKKGHPKARGEHMGAQTYHEGTQTKIPYCKDFDFYLKRLFKHTVWLREVMEYYNNREFRICTVSNTSKAPTSTTVPAQWPCSWEDNFLDEMDQDPDVLTSFLSPLQSQLLPKL